MVQLGFRLGQNLLELASGHFPAINAYILLPLPW